MKIAIDLTSLSYHMTGIERYAMCMTEEMLKHDLKNEYVLVFRNEIYTTFRGLVDEERVKTIILHGDNKVLFLQLTLTKALYKIKADKFIFFAFTSPILFRREGIINTVHDVGAWDSADAMKLLQKMYFRLTYRMSASASERIITVSDFSRGRISEVLKYPKDKINVIYSAVYDGVTKDYGYTFTDIQEKYDLPDKYIMTLSTLEPRKNLKLLLRAFTVVQDKVDYDLVLVGRKGWMMEEVLEKYNSSKRIHITGFVDDEHVSLIYKNALCFIFPTLYEGFGLPPVEALSMGTPVISSDAASMPEVLRKQAVYFKSNNQKELENLLLHLEDNVDTMQHELDEYQKMKYRFDVSAKKILELIGVENEGTN